MKLTCLALVLALLFTAGGHSAVVTAPPVSARDALDDGYVWLTIKDPGNKKYWNVGGDFLGRGSVDYVYQIAQTELLTREYLGFVEAYWPYYEGDPTDEPLTGAWIAGRRYGNGYVYEILPGYEDVPTTISLRNAARFCNWLHNGRVNEEWAFLTGAYDATTFTQNPDRTYNDDYTRLEGARYFIPTIDEWLKAVYYDANHDGPGEGGWWHRPNGTNEPLAIGYPENGGQTNGSLWVWYFSYFPAGMYPHVRTPWGLLDASGGVCELTQSGFALGSSFINEAWYVDVLDTIGYYHHNAFDNPNSASGTQGLRLGRPIE